MGELIQRIRDHKSRERSRSREAEKVKDEKQITPRAYNKPEKVNLQTDSTRVEKAQICADLLKQVEANKIGRASCRERVYATV